MEHDFSLPKNPINFRCTKCGACCSNPRLFITITVQDIHRWFIFGEELKTILKVIGFYIFKEEDKPALQEKLMTIPVQTEKGPAFLGMLRDPYGRCLMLDEKKQCKIYELRPMACRQFPIGISEDSENKKTIIGVSPIAVEICEGLGQGKRIKTEDLIELAKDSKYAIEGDIVFIEKWNEMVQNKEIEPSVENFLNFLKNAQNTHPELYQLVISKGLEEDLLTIENAKRDAKEINIDKKINQPNYRRKAGKQEKYKQINKKVEYGKKK